MHNRFRAPLLALAALALAAPLAAQADTTAPATGASATAAATNLPPDFVRRRLAGHGWFATREQFMRRHPSATLNIFTAAPGVRLVPDGNGGMRVQMTHRMPTSNNRDIPQTFTSQKGETSQIAAPGPDSGPNSNTPQTMTGTALTQVGDQPAGDAGSDECRVQYYRNGERIYPEREALVSRDIPVESVEAVEVYRSKSETPPQFRVPGADCGVIVIWTGAPAAGS